MRDQILEILKSKVKQESFNYFAHEEPHCGLKISEQSLVDATDAIVKLMGKQTDTTTPAISSNGMLHGVFSMREFEVSAETKVDCANYQMILDYNGVAILFSNEYSNRESTGVKILKERMSEMIKKLNDR